MKLLRIGLVLVTLLLSPLYAVAAGGPAENTAPPPNWYAVELIVFRYTDPRAGSLETWPVNPGTPDWQAAQPLAAPSLPANTPFRELTPVHFRMDSYWRKLQRSSDYLPLLHVAWVQPAIDRASAPFVRIGTPPASAAPTAVTAAPSGAAALGGGVPVYGIARLSTTGPYLHFDLDLVFCGPPAAHLIPPPPGPSAAASVINAPTATTAAITMPVAAACQPYRLKQGRRIDAGRLDYFDHPMFGVLLLVTPQSK